MRTTLRVELFVDEGREVEAARAMLAQLPPAQWKVLAQLAAEVVALWETAAAGQRVLVVPAAEMGHEVHQALRLKPAG